MLTGCAEGVPRRSEVCVYTSLCVCVCVCVDVCVGAALTHKVEGI